MRRSERERIMTRKEYYFTTNITTVTVYALVNLHSLNTEEWRSVWQNKSDFHFFWWR